MGEKGLDFKHKEVINISNAKRLGYVQDVCADLETGSITNIIVPGERKLKSMFNNNEDIHRQTASKVFDIPMEEVTSKQRSDAKAVNFGIVYGISDFGLAEQLGIGRKKAKQYIEQYLEQYSGIKQFMTDIVEQAKEKGYVLKLI